MHDCYLFNLEPLIQLKNLSESADNNSEMTRNNTGREEKVS